MNDQTVPRRRLPDVKFRVLIVGRANAGKTSILQRVCDTTESPITYVVIAGGRREVRLTLCEPDNCAQGRIDSSQSYVRGTLRCISMEPDQLCFSQRGQHEISDELEFSNHKGYVFHDSRGLESGTADELQIIRNFVGDRSRRKRLEERLHAIWSVLRRSDWYHFNLFAFRYCIPMDGNRESLDIEPFHNICPDKNGKLSTFNHTRFSCTEIGRAHV